MKEKSTTYKLFDEIRCCGKARALLDKNPDAFYDLPYKFAERFPERQTCYYLSLMAYVLYEQFKELDYRKTCLTMIEFLEERRFHFGRTNIKRKQNGGLIVKELSYAGFKNDLKYLQKSFLKFYKHHRKHHGCTEPIVLGYYINDDYTMTAIAIEWQLY